MYKRPTNKDTEEDLINMQNEFLSKKDKEYFAPAAKVVKLKPKSISKFAQSRLSACKDDSKNKDKLADTTNEQEDTGAQLKMNETVFVLGDIVERNPLHSSNIPMGSEDEDDNNVDMVDDIEMNNNESIPIIDQEHSKQTNGKSIFAQSFCKMKSNKLIVKPLDVNDADVPSVNCLQSKTNVLSSSEAKAIDCENIEKINNMTSTEISEALESINQSEVLRNYFKKKTGKCLDTQQEQTSKKPEQPEQMSIEDEDHGNEINVKNINSLDAMSLTTQNLLKECNNFENLLNFNIIEPEKLEWMKDIPNKIKNFNPNESYEARFDWKGILLPYTKTESTVDSCKIVDDRELYLHGDDAHRPGYTLQELFRLARSIVVQQRIAAINSITGILQIYNQGFYDQVLELPISKIFFLLRFAFDDNTLPMLECTSKALSALFYNESDEMLLDFTYDGSIDCLEPNLELTKEISKKKDNDNVEQMEENLSKLNITANGKIFQNTIHETEDDLKNYQSINDFYLAEIDLIECLLRTNIMQRINYIFTQVKPDNSTIENCLKILIRLARTNRTICEQILENEQLIQTIMTNFLKYNAVKQKQYKFYHHPQALAMKLLRIIASNCNILLQNLIEKFKLDESIKDIIAINNDLNLELIKIQIESFRIAKIFHISSQSTFFNSISTSMRYLLEWHYQFIIFDNTGSSILRQHAAATISLIGHINNYELCETLMLCFSKWFDAAMKLNELQEFSQMVLLTSCLNTYSMYLKEPHSKFLESNSIFMDYFEKFMTSTTYFNITKQLRETSILLSSYRLRIVQHKPLPHLQSIIIDKNNLMNYIIKKLYPLHFINSLFEMHLILHETSILNPVALKCGKHLNEFILEYLKSISSSSSSASSSPPSSSFNKQLIGNWFLRTEMQICINFIKLFDLNAMPSAATTIISKRDILNLTVNILPYINVNDLENIIYLFSTILFKYKYYNNDTIIDKNNTMMEYDFFNTQRIYYEMILTEHFLNNVNNNNKYRKTLVIPTNRQQTVLPNDWLYRPLLWLLSSITDQNVKMPNGVTEKDIILKVLHITGLLMKHSIHSIGPTEKLRYIMMLFLGTETTFLDPDVKLQINNYFAEFLKQSACETFEFDKELEDNVDEKKYNFQNLYTLFLNQFQATSYGDDLFGAVLMIPLQQKYDVKWRKLVWSEHAEMLRFVRCTENQLIDGTIDKYLYPYESDVSLIKSYYQTISSLRIQSIPYKIAEHHLNNYRKNIKPTN